MSQPQSITLQQEPAKVADRLGRVLTLRKLTVLDRLRLFKAAGPVLAENHPWFGMAILAASVAEVDGVPIPIPVNESQIEAAVSRLGDDGLTAVANALDEEDELPVETRAGNSPGTPT
jgi:hypothetical protein